MEMLSDMCLKLTLGIMFSSHQNTGDFKSMGLAEACSHAQRGKWGCRKYSGLIHNIHSNLLVCLSVLQNLKN